MGYYSVAQDHKMSGRKPLYRNRIFISLFALSLGFNLYFYYERDGRSPDADQIAPQKIAVASPVKAPEKLKKTAYIKPENPADQEIKVLHFDVENSINHTLCKSMPKVDCELMTAYMGRILGWHFDLNKYLRKGDSGYVIYKSGAGEDPLRILRLRYRSQYLRKTLEINYFKNPDSEFGAYFDSEGTATAARIAKPQAPVRDYIEITSLPGDFRQGSRAGHGGTDFKTPVGTPVYSSFDGLVTRINWNRKRNGYCLEIDHPREKIKSLYLHLNKVLVQPGAKVKQGQQVGESGNTGRSFAPHLHYEVRSRGPKKIIYNPFKLKNYKTYNKKISAGMMPDFKNTLNTYDALINRG